MSFKHLLPAQSFIFLENTIVYKSTKHNLEHPCSVAAVSAPPKTGGSGKNHVVRLDKAVSCNKTGGPWVKTFENPLDLLMPNFCSKPKRIYTAQQKPSQKGDASEPHIS